MSATTPSAPALAAAWPVRPLLAYRGSPLALGALVTCSYLLVAALYHVLAGSFAELPPSVWADPFVWSDLLYGLTLGLAPLALVASQRGAEQELGLLCAVLGEPEAAARARVFAPSRTAWMAGVAVGLGFIAFDLGLVWEDLSSVSPRFQAWAVLREIVCDLAIFWSFAWLVVVAVRLSRLAPPPERIRLLALDEFSLFNRHGIRLALLLLTLWALWIPAYVAVGEELLFAGVGVTAVGTLFSAFALWLPTRHLRRSVREARWAELAELRGAIESARARALDPRAPDAAGAAARLPGLLAYERRIEEIHPSTLDSQVLGRVALYLLIPLGSWVASALVERSVNTLLD